MAKTTTTPQQFLLDDVDWTKAMSAERSAGGHQEIMDALFTRSTVLGGYIEDDWQGSLAYAYKLPSKHVAIISDSFGSCSGCDSWEGASDEEARRMITAMVTSAHIRDNEHDALAWLRTFPQGRFDSAGDFLPMEMWDLRNVAQHLADDIEARKLICIPKDTPASPCKACGATMYFVGKNPISVDVTHGKAPNPNATWRDSRANRASKCGLGEGRGISHFANCPNAEQFRKRDD